MNTRLEIKLRDCRIRVVPFASGSKLWDDVLTDADRTALGGDLLAAHGRYGTIGMWARVRGITNRNRALVEVAYELGFLDELGRKRLISELNQDESLIEQTIDDVVQAGYLVLVESRREAFWQGKPIAIDWHRRSAWWNFFVLLCETAKRGQSLDHTSFTDAKQPEYVNKTKSALRRDGNFPTSLFNLIVSAGRYTIRLNLPPHQIHIFSVTSHDVLTEAR